MALGRRQPAGPPHGHGLEVLGTHHRPDAATRGRIVPREHDAGEQDLVLAGRADDRGLNRLVAQLFLDQVVCLARALPPQVPRIPDLNLVIVHPEVYGTGRRPLDDHKLPTGVAQHRADMAADRNLQIQPRCRALARDRRASRRRGVGPGQGAGAKDHDVLRTQRIQARTGTFVEEFGGDAPASQEPFQVIQGHLLDPRLALGQIDIEDALL